MFSIFFQAKKNYQQNKRGSGAGNSLSSCKKYDSTSPWPFKSLGNMLGIVLLTSSEFKISGNEM
jgi:hypothetical protein